MTLSQDQRQSAGSLGRILRKYFVSGFVVLSFGAYALHEHLVNQVATAEALPVAQSPVPTLQLAPKASPTPPDPTAAPPSAASDAPGATVTVAPTATQAPPPTAIPPSPTPEVALGPYKDGQYDGPTVDVLYGLVQVRAVIQNGQIANVQFLDYPHDRRTSQRINSIAMPYLTTEALQVQSAHVNIISGATLTSEGFAMSLNQALQTALR
jgi:uncharacterized protein with FMN-binding domain